ncbi:MAG: hypothetical protein M0Z45_11125 [Actinomycetota bacterium]|nr:hypothetical protein [Actinomycetota bacterium]
MLDKVRQQILRRLEDGNLVGYSISNDNRIAAHMNRVGVYGLPLSTSLNGVSQIFIAKVVVKSSQKIVVVDRREGRKGEGDQVGSKYIPRDRARQGATA